MLSVSEGRQINTTKHFGGGVNVSAGATLLIKAGALSRSLSHSHKFIHSKTDLTSKQIHTTRYTHTHTQ